MQTENLPKISHKQFCVIFNTNQIKLYTYPDLLRENNLNIKLYKHSTCIPRWNETEMVISASFQREINVVRL